MTLPRPAESGISDCDDTAVHRLAATLEDIGARLTGPPEELRRPPEAAIIGFLHLAAVREVHMAAKTAGNVEKAIASELGRIEQLVGDAAGSKHALARMLHDVEGRYHRWRQRA